MYRYEYVYLSIHLLRSISYIFAEKLKFKKLLKFTFKVLVMHVAFV